MSVLEVRIGEEIKTSLARFGQTLLQLVINRKTTKAIGLTIQKELVSRADKVTESRPPKYSVSKSPTQFCFALTR